MPCQSTIDLVKQFRKVHQEPYGMVNDKDLKWAEAQLLNEIESSIWTSAFQRAIDAGTPERDCHRIADECVKQMKRKELLEEVLNAG